MQLKTRLKYTAALVAAALSLSSVSTYASSVSIENAGFEENSFDGWEDVEPLAISSNYTNSGLYAAKLTGEGAEVEQTVDIEENTDYQLTAYVAGTGKLGVVVGDSSESIATIGGGSSIDVYEKVTVNFNSGSATSARIFGVYVDGEVRFDDFALQSVESVDAYELEISSAFDDGTAYGSYTADKAIDDDTDWYSRWAAYADAAAVNLTAQLAAVSDVTQVGIVWGDGETRTYTFEIYARATTSGTDTWTKVYDGVSSGTSNDIEVYDIADISAQQVRIKVIESSKGDGWANISEVKVYSATAPEGSTDIELAVDSAFDEGTSYGDFTADQAIDGDADWYERWAAFAEDDALNLTLQLDEISDVSRVGIVWGRGETDIYTFEIYARAVTSGTDTWTKVYTGTSRGTAEIDLYDVTDISAQQVRIKVLESNIGDGWANINEVTVYGSISSDTNTDTDTDTDSDIEIPVGDADYPSDLMRNYDQWKITYPDGEEEKQLYQKENEFFYVNDDKNGIVFYAPIRSDNGTTPNSDNIRSELREREEDGSADIYWTTDGTHVLYVQQAITHLPIKYPNLVATQIHGDKEAGIDDSMVMRLEDEHLFLSFNGGELRSNHTIKTDYKLGTVHEVIFEVIDGKHYVYYSEEGGLHAAYLAGNADTYLVKDGSNNYVMDLDYDQSYFKVGNYTQSNPVKEGDETDNPDNYGEVVVYDFWVEHED